MKLPIVSPDPYVAGQRLIAWARANALVRRAYERALVNRYTKELLASPEFMLDATVEAPSVEAAPAPEPAPAPETKPGPRPTPDLMADVVGGLLEG